MRCRTPFVVLGLLALPNLALGELHAREREGGNSHFTELVQGRHVHGDSVYSDSSDPDNGKRAAEAEPTENFNVIKKEQVGVFSALASSIKELFHSLGMVLAHFFRSIGNALTGVGSGKVGVSDILLPFEETRRKDKLVVDEELGYPMPKEQDPDEQDKNGSAMDLPNDQNVPIRPPVISMANPFQAVTDPEKAKEVRDMIKKGLPAQAADTMDAMMTAYSPARITDQAQAAWSAYTPPPAAWGASQMAASPWAAAWPGASSKPAPSAQKSVGLMQTPRRNVNILRHEQSVAS